MTRPKAERPKSIHVGAFVYRIEYLDEIAWQAANEDDSLGGVTRAAVGSIRVRLPHEVSEQIVREILLHEVLHAVWHSTMLTHVMSEYKDSVDVEETVCQATSPMLLQVLIDNPDFVRYIRGV
jgi:hypothetical protein